MSRDTTALLNTLQLKLNKIICLEIFAYGHETWTHTQTTGY